MYEKVLYFFKRTHKKIKLISKRKKLLPLTKEVLKSYQEAKVCYFCGKRILKNVSIDKNYQKVRDHCHYTGKYRAAAHSICSLKKGA